MAEEIPFYSESINEWLEKSLVKYKVNILSFVHSYIYKLSDATDKWPLMHRKKSDSKYWPYDYDYKQKKNLFNLDSFYKRISNKPFIKGHKQELEILMMYDWLHSIETDDEYWDEYLAKMLPVINK